LTVLLSIKKRKRFERNETNRNPFPRRFGGTDRMERE
jgi:hypothetical protein